VSWAGILFAVLGSSALGAIFGGYLTTRMRGRIEREEAWRTRLIEATDELNGVLVAALTTLGGLLPGASRGETPLRSGDALTPETADVLASARDLLNQAEVRLSRVELLFSAESEVQVHGYETMHQLNKAVALLRGRGAAQTLVRAVLAERENLGAGRAMLAEQVRDIPVMENLLARSSLPGSFEPSDDVNVAQWARALHNAAGESAHRYMRAARAEIERYRSP
jgi:hypothetical protein